MAYIGKIPATGAFQKCDDLSASATADYTLQISSTNVIPESVNHMIVSLNGVIQSPTTAFTVSGAVLSFASALTSADSIDFVILLGNVLDIGTPSDSVVTSAKLSGNLVTPGTLDVNGQELILDADADTSITADTDDQIDIKIGGTDSYQLTSTFATGGETAPDACAGGITIDQNALDTAILTFKSSDVAHGITDQAETDTYLQIKKFDASEGYGRIMGFGESRKGLVFDGVFVDDDTTTSTSATGPVWMRAFKKNGTAYDGTINADQNIFIATGLTSARFLVKGDGDIYYDGADQGAYDDFDDAQLVRTLDLSRDKTTAGVINSKFDEYIKYNHENLAKAKLVGREKDGTPNHFINITGMQRLHNGAIWQQYTKHNQLLEAVYELAKEAVGEEKADDILEKHDIKLLK